MISNILLAEEWFIFCKKNIIKLFMTLQKLITLIKTILKLISYLISLLIIQSFDH